MSDVLSEVFSAALDAAIRVHGADESAVVAMTERLMTMADEQQIEATKRRQAEPVSSEPPLPLEGWLEPFYAYTVGGDRVRLMPDSSWRWALEERRTLELEPNLTLRNAIDMIRSMVEVNQMTESAVPPMAMRYHGCRISVEKGMEHERSVSFLTVRVPLAQKPKASHGE